MAARFVSSNSDTKYASAASWRAMTADDWKRKSVYEERQYRRRYDVRKRTYLEVLGNLTNETLEGQLADEKFR